MTTRSTETPAMPAGATWPHRGTLGMLCLAYVVLMLYSSTLVGPEGPNFVYREPVQAWQAFLATPYVIHGSDQRADWMSNMLMLIPFGFLVAGMIRPRRPLFRPPALLIAALICLAVILAIKYLQLFFPPRTVTLNYIAAQTLGALIGCGCSVIWHGRVAGSPRWHDPVAGFVLALRLYAGALLIFLLMPLDVALNAADLHAQLERLPATLLILPGSGRPLLVRAVLIVAAAAAFIPVGMLLTFVKDRVARIRRGVIATTLIGLALTSALFGLTTLVISAAPSVGAILVRTAGIAIGAASIRWLMRQDLDRLRARLAAWVPWLAIPYLVLLAGVNRLWSSHWLSPHDAMAQLHPLGLLPLFNYYIVTKAEAAKDLVGHIVMYLPVGAALWLRDPRQRIGGRAFLLAALLSLAVELGRWFRPGLQGDDNTVVVAGLSALLAARLMPMAWSTLKAMSRQSSSPPVRVWQTSASPWWPS